MSLRTYSDGVLVGYGPSVSTGAALQVEDDDAEVDVVVDDVVDVAELVEDELPGVTPESFLQAWANTVVDAAPTSKLFKNLFLSITNNFNWFKNRSDLESTG